ncbi:MAG: retropepsin-like aspartic protease family protein [bacterium]
MSSGTLYRFSSIAVWLALIAGLTFVFGWLLDKQHNPNQSNLTRILSEGVSEVVLARNREGHYVATGEINGRAVQFLVDTGATHISIPGAQAEKLGLERGAVMLAQTANGTVKVYATRLDKVKLGNIVLHNTLASINPGMSGDDILLGMSFLGHLEIIQRADTLRLRVPEQGDSRG